MQNSVASKRQKLSIEDLIFEIKKEPKKYFRAQELLRMDEVVKIAKKAFDPNPEKTLKKME